MLGFMLFAEAPTIHIWIGAAIIFTSSFYVAYRERQTARPLTVEPAGTP